MRKIKCRGRDEKRKWHYGYYVDGYMFDDMLGLWESVPFIVQRQLEGDVRVEAETVGQYTGVEDKNGKAIYEGDIVKCHNDLVYRVDWHEKDAMFYYKDPAGDEDEDLRMSAVSFEVIGNVYDNQNLIK